MITNDERAVMIAALNAIERETDEERQIAALCCFTRSVKGLKLDPEDIAVLRRPKKSRFMIAMGEA